MLLVFGVVSGYSFPDRRFQAPPSQHFFCRHAKMLALGVGCPVGELSERSDTEDSLLSWLRHGWRPAANRARRLRGTFQGSSEMGAQVLLRLSRISRRSIAGSTRQLQRPRSPAPGAADPRRPTSRTHTTASLWPITPSSITLVIPFPALTSAIHACTVRG